MKYFIILFLMGAWSDSIAQHDHNTPSKNTKWEHTAIFNKSFTDSLYAGEEITVVNFIVPPGGRDTVVHQHDCQLIGYIAEGEVITKMKDKAPLHLTRGQVFYEYPNEVHESLINPDPKNYAVIILYYLYQKGAVLYKKLDK
ncbi:MAG: cupin domain-containing protein [Saprospiraceae bacterium]